LHGRDSGLEGGIIVIIVIGEEKVVVIVVVIFEQGFIVQPYSQCTIAFAVEAFQGSGQAAQGIFREFTIQVQQLQKKASISDTAKNIKTLQETANGYLPSYYAL